MAAGGPGRQQTVRRRRPSSVEGVAPRTRLRPPERSVLVSTHTVRSRLLSAGLVCAGLVGLLGCGSPAASTPSAATVPSAATAASAASSTPIASPSPEVAAVCTATPIKFDPKAIDLTGAWAGDDGGIYYVRQLG